MNQNQVSGAADDRTDPAPQSEAKPSAEAGAETKAPASEEDGRLRKAYGDVKEALKNSRHT